MTETAAPPRLAKVAQDSGYNEDFVLAMQAGHPFLTREVPK